MSYPICHLCDGQIIGDELDPRIIGHDLNTKPGHYHITTNRAHKECLDALLEANNPENKCSNDLCGKVTHIFSGKEGVGQFFDDMRSMHASDEASRRQSICPNLGELTVPKIVILGILLSTIYANVMKH